MIGEPARPRHPSSPTAARGAGIRNQTLCTTRGDLADAKDHTGVCIMANLTGRRALVVMGFNNGCLELMGGICGEEPRHAQKYTPYIVNRACFELYGPRKLETKSRRAVRLRTSQEQFRDSCSPISGCRPFPGQQHLSHVHDPR